MESSNYCDSLLLSGQQVGQTNYIILEHLSGGKRLANVYYRGWYPRTNKKFIVKVEKISKYEISNLQIEFDFHCSFSSSIRNSNFRLQQAIAYGEIGQTGWCALVLPQLGPSLAEKHLEQPDKQFPINATINIAYQLLKIYEGIHENGLIYRDTRPENFCFGLPNDPDTKDKLYVSDLGSCDFKYHQDEFWENQAVSFPSNVLYSSINNHKQRILTQRDDIESLGYLFIHLASGSLPWENVKEESYRKSYEKVGEMKQTMSEFTLATEIGSMFEEILWHGRAPIFGKEVNYDYVWAIFSNPHDGALRGIV